MPVSTKRLQVSKPPARMLETSKLPPSKITSFQFPLYFNDFFYSGRINTCTYKPNILHHYLIGNSPEIFPPVFDNSSPEEALLASPCPALQCCQQYSSQPGLGLWLDSSPQLGGHCAHGSGCLSLHTPLCRLQSLGLILCTKIF